MKRIFTVILILNLFIVQGYCAKEHKLTIGNNIFTSTITVKDGSIHASSIYDKRISTELLVTHGAPIFEFTVNRTTVNSDMPVWNYISTEEQRLSNGGIIMTYKFEGKKSMKGLIVLIDREYFEDRAFIRERLRLKTKYPGKFQLTNVGGKNHFIFPRYTFDNTGAGNPTEIRIGSYGKEVLPDYEKGRTADKRPSRNLAVCHMFHPDFIMHNLSEEVPCEAKGPFMIVSLKNHKILSSYEHASQDYTYMKPSQQATDASLIDAAQGVKGESDIVTDDDLWFIANGVSQHGNARTIDCHIRRGGYIDGEAIPSEEYYETVWSTISILSDKEQEKDAIRDYLLNKITDNARSREHHFYYNTWGMQRDFSPNMRDVFTE